MTGVRIRIRRGDPNFDLIRKRVEELTKMFEERMPKIAVGLPKDSTPYPDGTSVIMVGFWNEYGSTDGVVPARPWLRTGAHNNRDEWLKLARRIIKKCIETGQDPINRFALLGLKMEADIKKSIETGDWESNQGAYAAWKVKHGYTKPLMVTGHMRASVRYVITEKRQDDNSQ